MSKAVTSGTVTCVAPVKGHLCGERAEKTDERYPLCASHARHLACGRLGFADVVFAASGFTVAGSPSRARLTGQRRRRDMSKTVPKEMVEMDLDLAGEPQTDVEIKAAARKYGLKAKLLKRHGPGGGWPQWLFSGPRTNFSKFLREWYFGGNDDEQAEDFIKMLETAAL